MEASQLRQKFLNFFQKKGHTILPSASLVPSTEVELAGTQKVLFTTAGMHPLIPYLLGKTHPQGKRLVNVQKSLRTDDINEVGDAWHNTFFEMLGNWSLGDYWKEETISWSFEFLTKELRVGKEKIWITVFGGDQKIPGMGVDEESIEVWKDLGIPDNRIFRLGQKDNWWGPVGETGPCGPDTEMFVDTTGVPHGPDCRPGDDCGRFAEVWNDVFMEYDRQKDGSFKPLEQKNVDTGMGLERTLAVLQKKNNVFETDVFISLVEYLSEHILTKFKYGQDKKVDRAFRIMADHLRAAVFLINDGIEPGNKDRGYVLRRLIRRAILQKLLWGSKEASVAKATPVIAQIFKEPYPEVIGQQKRIQNIIEDEEQKATRAISMGMKIFEKVIKTKNKTAQPLSAKQVFDLYQNYGLPIELTDELAKELGKTIDRKGAEELFKNHQEISRAGAQEKFAGGLADHSPKVIAGHTATHLLHQALRDILGNHVQQTGSNITEERIRFDFSHPQKMTEDEIEKVEKIVNEKIVANLLVKKEILALEKARQIGAIGLFGEKYPEAVNVYLIGDYSKEFCGGPHVGSTKELGKFKIVKEEGLGSNRRRIYAVLD